jgi:cyanophycin synthetase
MSGPWPETAGTTLVELRVLDGANLYFPRPAIKLTLDVPALLSLPEGAGGGGGRRGRADRRVAGAARAASSGAASPTRLLAHLVRRTAAAAGVRALAVRSRPGPEPTQVVVAYPWRRQHAAEALGRAVAELAAASTPPGWPSGWPAWGGPARRRARPGPVAARARGPDGGR